MIPEAKMLNVRDEVIKYSSGISVYLNLTEHNQIKVVMTFKRTSHN